MTTDGMCAPEFAAVREAFERNFTEYGDVGAAVHATVDGQAVVDLWGGQQDPVAGAPWQRDTLVHIWSGTKGAVALCAHLLVARGKLDLTLPVANYWPEFAAEGKGGILVRQLLNHQAGLPAVSEPLPPGAFYDWDLMVDALARQRPWWEPGTRHGYHGLTFGFLIGEVVRRVAGVPLGEFFRTEIAEPLGLDFWLGLPESEEHRVAHTIPADLSAPGAPVPSLFIAAMTDPASVAGQMLLNNGGYMNPGEADTRAAHAAVIGATGGITNARGLSGLYTPLANGGGGLVDEFQPAAMGAVSSASSVDAVVLVPSRFTLGFVKAIDNSHLPIADAEGILLSEEAFGHSGFGGSIGFADPRARLSFAYTMSRQGPGIGINERCQALVDATYAALGYRRPASGGLWVHP
ncbi:MULTISPECIES: serine hydrolase domain-containing protein [unclassified Kribbella]|uniref:serine hydrolase domain-containing protein n=1 Tax=unclassified Kribbella TaxID=2644121 RepID=UPI0030197D6F